MQKIVIGALALAAGAVALGQVAADRASRPVDSSRHAALAQRGEESLPGAPAGTNPDVILWEISGIENWSEGAFRAYSVGTTSCNVGDAPLAWISGNNQHPVIGQNMVRVSDGRIRQIGQSWLKHGFCALDLTDCGPCQGTGCTSLGIGCSDPYTASRNGSQGPAGPKYQVNATTGFFNYPPADPPYSGSTARRLRVAAADVTPANHPGGRWFVEGTYIHPEDSPADTGDASNNCSYREVAIDSVGAATGYVGATVREKVAIWAWQQVHADVSVVEKDLPGEGTYVLGWRVLDNGDGTWTYLYALQNVNSDRSVGSFSIPVADATSLFDIRFGDVDYHSGEPFDGTDWSFSRNAGVATWSTTPFAQDPNANALRWGTLYTFEFTADAPPVPATTTSSYFKTGGSFGIDAQGPDTAEELIVLSLPDGAPQFLDPAGDAITLRVEEVEAGGLGGTPMLHLDTGSGFVASALSPLGGELWSAAIPSLPCGTAVTYYFSAEQSEGTVRRLPFDAPFGAYQSLVATGSAVGFADDMETDTGWTVVNDASLTDGAWDRGVPAGLGDRGDPTVDGDGSGAAWLTDNVEGNSDVDGGPTSLISTTIDLSDAGAAEIAYDWWFTNDDFDIDRLTVDVSDDDGASWVAVHSWENAFGWQDASFAVQDYVALTATVRVRFSATDQPNDSVTEAGIDGLVVTKFTCGADPCPADVDGSGDVGFGDLVAVLAAWGPCVDCPEDVNGDDEVGFDDLVAVLAAWGPC